MDVLVKIFFEILQRLVKGLVADTRVGWHFVVGRYRAQLAQDLSGDVVFLHHHPHGIVHRYKGSKGTRSIVVECLRQTNDIREEYLLLFEHVRRQIRAKSLEKLADVDEFRMVASVRLHYFCRKCFEPGHF